MNIKFTNDESISLNDLMNSNSIQRGDGIFDWIKKGTSAISRFISGTRKNFSPQIREFIERNGNLQIQSLTIVRKPIFAILEKVLNLISLGQWERNKQLYSYDKMFHLYLVFVIGDRAYRIEKNEVIMIQNDDTDYTDNNIETLSVPQPRMLFFKDLLENGQKIVTPDEFFQYRAFSTNCQHFVKTLLQGSRLLTSEGNNFIMQDAQSLIKNIRFVDKIANTTTDLAGRIDHAIYGSGRKRMMQIGGCMHNKYCPCDHD